MTSEILPLTTSLHHPPLSNGLTIHPPIWSTLQMILLSKHWKLSAQSHLRNPTSSTTLYSCETPSRVQAPISKSVEQSPATRRDAMPKKQAATTSSTQKPIRLSACEPSSRMAEATAMVITATTSEDDTTIAKTEEEEIKTPTVNQEEGTSMQACTMTTQTHQDPPAVAVVAVE